MKEYHLRRSRIGGEELSSRYQVKENKEKRQPQVGFSRLEPQQQSRAIQSFSYIPCVHIFRF
jgi:hypothetical protein